MNVIESPRLYETNVDGVIVIISAFVSAVMVKVNDVSSISVVKEPNSNFIESFSTTSTSARSDSIGGSFFQVILAITVSLASAPPRS